MSRLFSFTSRHGIAPTVIIAILVLLVLVGLAAPWLPLSEAKQVGAGPRRSPPSLEWMFGTDGLGRSVLVRILEGIRITFLISAAAVMLAAIFGTLIGMLAAWYRGWVDTFVARTADVVFAFPAVIFGVIVATVIGPGILSAILAIFFSVLPTLTRVVRSEALKVVNNDYVVTARISGASTMRILLSHILPNVASVTIVQISFMLSFAMIVESGLSYLGLGIQPPIASLGSMLRENNAFLVLAPWTVLAPGAVLSLAIFCTTYVGAFAQSIIEPGRPRSLN